MANRLETRERVEGKESVMSSSRYDAAIERIVTHWKSGASLKEIAAAHGVDAGDLDRAFRLRHGVTASGFVRARREEYLRARLDGSRVYGYEIAGELGFPDDVSFYRWVKRSFGIPFSRLRRGLQGREGARQSDGAE